MFCPCASWKTHPLYLFHTCSVNPPHKSWKKHLQMLTTSSSTALINRVFTCLHMPMDAHTKDTPIQNSIQCKELPPRTLATNPAGLFFPQNLEEIARVWKSTTQFWFTHAKLACTGLLVRLTQSDQTYQPGNINDLFHTKCRTANDLGKDLAFVEAFST